MTGNFVHEPPTGIVIGIQYFSGDLARAMRVARLISDIEKARRSDVIFAFCRRFDVPDTKLEFETMFHVAEKFPTIRVRSKREAIGHPDGSFSVWAGTLDHLTEAWLSGRLNAHSAFLFEADGVPLRCDWIDQLIEEHARTVDAGKRITGPEMIQRTRHLNGTLAMHLSCWADRPSLHRCPKGQAWDLFHAAVINAEGRPTRKMLNVYSDCEWTPESLKALSAETVWLCSQKGNSALEWAEANLVTAEAGTLRRKDARIAELEAKLAEARR